MHRVKLGELWMDYEFDAMAQDFEVWNYGNDVEHVPETTDEAFWKKTGYSKPAERKALRAVFLRKRSKKGLLSTIELPDEESARELYAFLLRSMYAELGSLGGSPEENYLNHWRWKRGMQSLRRQLLQQGISDLEAV